MSKTKTKDALFIGLAVGFFILALLMEFLEISFVKDEFYNRFISKTLEQSCGAVGGIFLIKYLKIQVFGKIEKALYLIPCLIIAIDNLQWFALFSGKMSIAYNQPIDFVLFFIYCLSVGLFEELIFRGILFSFFARLFPKNKGGFLLTFLISSLVFGLAHLLNGNLLQVAYSILTGGLFAFCLVKTKNVLCSALVHAVYNFCGLLFDKEGLGTGVVFDTGTVITMLIVSIVVGVFVIYKILKYPEDERERLYDKLIN